MTSIKQIRANRQNAKKSTGPKSKAGKERSARNPIKHGLFTDVLLLPHEDADALAALKSHLQADFKPVTHMQALAIDRLAMLIWRERRLALSEASEIKAQQRARPIGRTLAGKTLQSEARAEVHASAGTLDLARMLLVGRYQTMLTNQIERALKQFFELVEREDLFAPQQPAETPANDTGPATISATDEQSDTKEAAQELAFLN